MFKLKNNKTAIMILIAAIVAILIPSSVFGYRSYAGGKYYKDGVGFINSEKYDEAINAFNNSLKYSKKREKDIKAKVELVKSLKSSKEEFEKAVKSMSDKNYVDAITSFRKIPKEDTKRYADAQSKLDECRKIFVDENIENAGNEAKKNNYQEALKFIASILDIFNDEKSALALKEEYTNLLAKLESDKNAQGANNQTAATTTSTSSSTSTTTGPSSSKQGWAEVVSGSVSQNNLANQGYVAVQGDWIYYYALRENVLYKIKSDGSNKTKILSANIDSMVVKGSYIYFVNSGDEHKIYRVGVDGSNCKSINEAYFPSTDNVNLTMYGDWLVYIDLRMFSMTMLSLDGKQFNSIHNHAFKPTSLYIWNGEVYGINRETGYSIYKLKFGESEGVALNNHESSYLSYSNGNIFYSNESDGGKLYRVASGGSPSKLSDDKAVWKNAVGDWIYYANANDGNSLYKIKSDGSGRTKLNSDFSCYPNIIGNWIIYQGKDATYMMKTDGSHRIKL